MNVQPFLRAMVLSGCALLILFVAAPSFAIDVHGHNRATKNTGLYLSLHGDPAPSGLGANLAWTLGEAFQVHGGVGTYNGWIGNASDYSVGFLVRAITYPFAWLGYGFGRLIKTGHVDKHWRWGDHMRPQQRDLQSITAYGGGTKLFVPGMNLSPTAGVGWATYETRGHPDRLPDKGHHVYYTGGLDYVSSSGGNVGAGIQFCPGIEGRRWCGFYINLGGMM